VPYVSGLNAGHQTIVGMDIIATLSEYYNLEMPIFCDNAEGVTSLPEINAQVISLIKPEIKRDKNIKDPEERENRYQERKKKYSKLVIEYESKNEYREAV
jgi:hypothetical protein